MNKIFILSVFALLVISIFSFSVIAKDNDNSADSDSDNRKSSKDGSSSSENKEDKDDNNENDEDNDKKETKETKIITDEQGRKVNVETKTETKNGESETEEKRTFIDENGNKVTIITESETKNGESETTVKRKIVTPSGIEITFKTETEIENGEIKTKNSVEIKGVGFETKLEVKEETEDGKTKLKAKLSTGAEQEIITTPDEVLKTALGEIGGKNIIIELNEVVEGNQREAVFKAKTINTGKFLGIFDVNVNLETLVDTQTGAIIKTNRPWWAFLVTGADKAIVCHVSAENPNKRNTIEIAIPAVKAHLAHGDSVGQCPSVCGDGILIEGTEICEIGINGIRTCTTTEGYTGTEVCNLLCNGYDVCVTTESCGDGIVNGLEACDDGNTVNGDGCNLCKIEPTPTITTETPTAETTATTTEIVPTV